MVDLVALGLRLVVMAAMLAVALYSFRLQLSFKGGVYESILALIGRGAVLLTIGEVLGTVALVTKIYDLFWATNVLEVLFFAMLMLAIQKFYRTWKVGIANLQNKTSSPATANRLAWGRMTVEERLVSLYGPEGARLMLKHPDAIQTVSSIGRKTP